jgi:pyruvate carboxylase subunit B
MRYFVTIGDSVVEVELAGDRTTVDGCIAHVELRSVPGTPIRHLLVDQRSYALVARAIESEGSWEITVHGRRFQAAVVDERARVIRELTSRTIAPRGPKPVRAPMPGLVVRVEVEPGQTVRPGQGVVIVEAMKMESELKADGGGIVRRVLVAPGQTVEKGAILIEFDPVSAGTAGTP